MEDEIRMIWLIACLVALICLMCLYIWMLRPNRPRRSIRHLAARDYAHRGLWNEERPENTLSAFRAAADNGFGIELDVHMTADGYLVVHHDDSLLRLCGENITIGQSPLEAVRACRVAGTEEQVPLFDEVLEAVNGRVPLIVEIKVEQNVAPLCRAVYERMLTYRGAWCMESFDGRAVQWFRKNAPEVIRGQLAFRRIGVGDSLKEKLTNLVVSSMLQNALGRPDFIAYEAAVERPRRLPMRLIRRMRPWMVAWTVRSQEEMDRLRLSYNLQIFEGFMPRRS